MSDIEKDNDGGVDKGNLETTLKRQRKSVKGNITRIKNLLESSTTKWSPTDLECRLEILTSYIERIMSIQTQIEEINDDNRRSEIEELCIGAKSKLLSLLGRHRQRECNSMDSTLGVTIPPPTRLPNLKLPSFGGKYCDYNNFISSFNNLVDEEPTLSQIEKFNHLLTCLTGEALSTVKSFQVTGDNYPKALSRLAERYDKKSLIFFDHIEHLFDIPKMSAPDASALRNAVDTVSAIYGSLKSLGTHAEIVNALIIHLILSRVDSETRSKWNDQLDYSMLPTWDDCAKVLIRRSQSLDVNEDRSLKNDTLVKKKDKKKGGKSVFSCSQSSNGKACLYCKAPAHSIQDCGNFASVSVADRFDFAKKNSCCLNCLRVGHVVAKCKAPRCKVCKKPHHQLLHRYEVPNQVGGIENGSSNMPSSSGATSNQYTALHVEYRSTVILATAVVQVKDRFGNFQPVRALLDSGSQLNLMTEECSRRLKLRTEPNDMRLNGVGSVCLKSNHKVTTIVKSRVNSYQFQDEFYILDSISSYQPETHLMGLNEKIPTNIPLADPIFNKSQKIDMLIGTDIFFEILCVGQIKLGNSLPKLQKTLLGWIIAGKSKTTTNSQFQTCNLVEKEEIMDSLNTFVHKFWDLEELPNRLNNYSEEHAKCELHFKETTTILPSGRFEVKLPFKESPSVLGSSFEIAKRRYLALERRLSRTPDVKLMYTNFMAEYMSLGHMSEIKTIPSGPHYFIPHHCVLRPQSLSTKLRVVFDASCRTASQKSLNEILMVGPTIQPELYITLLRFRCYRFAMTADVTKMYRQVMVERSDRNYQLILWREDESLPIKIFCLNTVTYGTAPAPFLAIRCLKELGDINKERYPLGSDVVNKHFYVDDMLTGADTIEELKVIKSEVDAIMKSGCFELAKWYYSNDTVNKDQISEKDLRTKETNSTKTLGMTWVTKGDCFQFKLEFNGGDFKATKRNILALSARLYDPLGLVSPFIVKAKVILQHLWMQKLNWDESVPMSIETLWEEFKKDLIHIDKICIPRYMSTLQDKKAEIHGFADASEIAYGCCLYVRATNENTNVVVKLLTAKSRVAPLKNRNIPRLELCAAHLLTKLWLSVAPILLPYINRVCFWSDSEIVLYWLKKYPSTLSTFVGNRVADIQEWSIDATWRHVPTKSNPADIVSRGCSVDDLNKSIWFQGPEFLQYPENKWPSNEHVDPTDEEKGLEIRKTKSTFVATNAEGKVILNLINKFSSYMKILRIVAYMYRFIRPKTTHSPDSKKDSCITADELNLSFLKIVETIQNNDLNGEIKDLKNNVVIKSSVQKLNPFLQQEKCLNMTMELIRVGGRLLNAPIEYDTKNPFLLPKGSRFVELYAEYLHFKNCHAGPKVLLSLLRQKVWVVNGREVVSRVLRKCIHCFRYRPKLLNQIMGNLPKDRFNFARPFIVTGVDFCGPIYTSYKIRGKPPYKSYVCIFVCFASKAVHIEPVSDLSTNAFVSVLKRFTGRRGLPARIYCDNATNFVGANSRLKELKDEMFSEKNQKEINNYVAENGIKFVFIPPRSPHFGGLWEAAVKSTKNLLYRTIANANLTFEQLTTILVEIEGILNSRPIAPITEDPNDGGALTPGDLLIGTSLKNIPEIRVNTADTTAKQWRQISNLKAQFWKIFQRDYIVGLQNRTKWSKPSPNLQIGAMVIVHEDNGPPQRWLYGRVVAVVAGEDGMVRVADIKTRNGIIRRAIHKLALLPI